MRQRPARSIRVFMLYCRLNSALIESVVTHCSSSCTAYGHILLCSMYSWLTSPWRHERYIYLKVLYLWLQRGLLQWAGCHCYWYWGWQRTQAASRPWIFWLGSSECLLSHPVPPNRIVYVGFVLHARCFSLQVLGLPMVVCVVQQLRKVVCSAKFVFLQV